MGPGSSVLLLENWRNILCQSELIISAVKVLESNTELQRSRILLWIETMPVPRATGKRFLWELSNWLNKT